MPLMPQPQSADGSGRQRRTEEDSPIRNLEVRPRQKTEQHSRARIGSQMPSRATGRCPLDVVVLAALCSDPEHERREPDGNRDGDREHRDRSQRELRRRRLQGGITECRSLAVAAPTTTQSTESAPRPRSSAGACYPADLPRPFTNAPVCGDVGFSISRSKASRTAISVSRGSRPYSSSCVLAIWRARSAIKMPHASRSSSPRSGCSQKPMFRATCTFPSAIRTPDPGAASKGRRALRGRRSWHCGMRYPAHDGLSDPPRRRWRAWAAHSLVWSNRRYARQWSAASAPRPRSSRTSARL